MYLNLQLQAHDFISHITSFFDEYYYTLLLREKCPNTELFLVRPYFPVFGLNTEIYEVNLRIQSEYRKIRTRNNSVFGHFSPRVLCTETFSTNWYS